MAVSTMAHLGVYILTFNCARNPIQTEQFASHLFDALPRPEPASTPTPPDILVLSLQEIAPLFFAFLGGSLLDAYYEPFRRAVAQAAGEETYKTIVTKNVGMTALMVFVREDIADRISWIETAEVGVGVQEVGNKGAVGARLGYQLDRGEAETAGLTFVAAHLAPNEHGVERRNEDWKSIYQRLVFTRADASKDNTHQQALPVEEQEEAAMPLLEARSSMESMSSSVYAPGTYLFVAGDLNYRTSNHRPGLDDYMRYPQSTDDLCSSRHWNKLLAHDQLTKEMQSHQTLQNLIEEPIKFPPTYKFSMGAPPLNRNVAADGEWDWAQNRWPSWCDRILYSEPNSDGDSRRIKAHNYDALPRFLTSDHRAVALSASIPLQPLPEPAVTLSSAFEIDPSWKGRRASARRKEILAGVAGYGIFTWEGNAVILATCLSVSAGYLLSTYLAG